MDKRNQYSRTFTLTAGESDAEGLMPLTLVVERVIEVATEHANLLGIGYDTLIKSNIGWVLSRLSVEIYRYPIINAGYTLTTWIESYNRRFSERNFVMTDQTGDVIGYIRTVWVAMNFETRTVADLSVLYRESFPTADLPCPIERTPRIPQLPAESDCEEYTFRYCDLDFNRHVNTVRYLDLILNHWSLEHYDDYEIRRFDILFHHECYYGQKVILRVAPSDDSASICEILRDDARCIAARIIWKKLNKQDK